MKPYYEHNGITIYHGDCREILPLLNINKGLICVDPPYGINHSSSHGASWQNTTIANDNDTSLRDFIVDWGISKSLSMAVFGTWKVIPPKGTKATLIWDKGPAFGMGDLSFPWKLSFEEIYIIGNGWQGRRDEGVLKGHLVVSWESHGRCHPHEKPVSLFKHLINKHPDELVIDPCFGSGAALVAAKELCKNIIGIELDEKYCEIAAERLRQEVFYFP